MSKIFSSPMEDNHDGAFTVDGFCRKYGIGRTAFYEEVTAGRLKAKKRGTRNMIKRRRGAEMVCQSAPPLKSRAAEATA